MELSISLIAKFQLKGNDLLTYAYSLQDGTNGKLLFINEMPNGEFVLEKNISEEHIANVQHRVDFIHVNYTLFVEGILEKIKSNNVFYKLEMFSLSVIRLLTESKSNATKGQRLVHLLETEQSVALETVLSNAEASPLGLFGQSVLANIYLNEEIVFRVVKGQGAFSSVGKSEQDIRLLKGIRKQLDKGQKIKMQARTQRTLINAA